MTYYDDFGMTRFDRKQAGYGNAGNVLWSNNVILLNNETGEVIEASEFMIFVSYGSIVAFYHYEDGIINVYPLSRYHYSRTTSKQCTQFFCTAQFERMGYFVKGFKYHRGYWVYARDAEHPYWSTY